MNYIIKWTKHLEIFGEAWKWIELNKIPEWNDGLHPVECSFSFLVNKKKINTSEFDDTYLEFGNIKMFLEKNENMMSDWKKNKVTIETRWIQIFQYMENENISYKKFAKLVEFAFAIPGNIKLLQS